MDVVFRPGYCHGGLVHTVHPTTAAIVGGAHGAPYGRAAEHYNPVKHGLVTKVSDWPYSTFHRHVRLGTYEPDWAGTTPEPEPAATGEP